MERSFLSRSRSRNPSATSSSARHSRAQGHMSLPRLPRLGRASRRKNIATARLKRAIKHAAMRDCDHRCVYCATQLDFDVATLDHVHPLAHGGAHVAGNLVLACARCNRLKGDLLPSEFFSRHPWAGLNFIAHARAVHRALKRCAKRAVSLAFARAA